jgi:hypothetical protein
VRLFVVWCALAIVREVFAFMTSWRPQADSNTLVFAIGGVVLPAPVLLILWFFPNSIARGLLPRAVDAPTQTLSYQMWFTLGTALLGLWFVASAISPILRNLSAMYLFRSELIDPEDIRSLHSGLLFYGVEVVLGLCLLFGATGIRKLVWRIRNAGPD